MTNAQYITQPTRHRMLRRSLVHDYCRPGVYHVTLRVPDSLGQPFGRIAGDAGTARVELTAVGAMVADELCHAVGRHYPMVTVDTYVVMPEHLPSSSSTPPSSTPAATRPTWGRWSPASRKGATVATGN